MELINVKRKFTYPFQFVSINFTFSHENRTRLGHETDQMPNENLHTRPGLYLHQFLPLCHENGIGLGHGTDQISNENLHTYSVCIFINFYLCYGPFLLATIFYVVCSGGDRSSQYFLSRILLMLMIQYWIHYVTITDCLAISVHSTLAVGKHCINSTILLYHYNVYFPVAILDSQYNIHVVSN